MTRGTNFLKSSTCRQCKRKVNVARPYGHFADVNNIYLNCSCPSWSQVIRLHYTPENSKKMVGKRNEGVYDKVLNPAGNKVIKNSRTSEIRMQLATLAASENPADFINERMPAGNFFVIGKSIKSWWFFGLTAKYTWNVLQLYIR